LATIINLQRARAFEEASRQKEDGFRTAARLWCPNDEKPNIMAAPTINAISALNYEKEAANQVESPSLSNFARIKAEVLPDSFHHFVSHAFEKRQRRCEVRSRVTYLDLQFHL
jgi:hypothetical protein